MQRMMGANGVQPDAGETGRGVQADQAFGNVLALLGGNADQRQGAEMRALGGDERRFGESMNSQARSMTLGVDLAMARAREAYDKEKWQYGEDIARQNYEARREAALYNNQGTNQTRQMNTQGVNDAVGGNVQTLLQLLAQGSKIPEMVLAGGMGMKGA